MAQPPSFPLYVQDYLTGTMALTPAERGCYVDCLCYQWEVDGVPGDDPARLALVMRCSPAESKRVWRVIASKFRKGDDGLYRNERLEAEREAKRRWHETRRENGALGGRPPKHSATTRVTTTVTDEKPSGLMSSPSPLVPNGTREPAPPAAKRLSYADPHGMRLDPTAAAHVVVGPEQLVAIPGHWWTKARREYRLTDADLDAFVSWLKSYTQRHGFEDGGKRLPYLDARLADFRAERANPNDGLRPASEWIAERMKRDAEVPEISAERRRELLRPVRAVKA